MSTEIGKTGEVIVEGHAIGRLDGFTFAPDAAEAGSDAKALQAAAQQVLAKEIDARAEKLGAAADEQFVLTSDGTIRWTGDAVAKLVAAEDALRPRLRIIADERLTGAAREKVERRLDLWLKTHVEKLLGPMFDLSKAEDVTGIARGIAFQLVEALGVLERNKIAAEMKDLDQPSRAILRKYGVRFGAYHIYFPALLKPAARSLASLLWALKQDNIDPAVLSGAQHLASSGRTSFPVDKALPRDAYRVLGYRQCGERAVRVDILERLADLIRPALGWRETSPGPKPSGAFDGRSFVVTQAMTSLTGSAGEDFASILRALGYRMERRPPLPPKPVVVAETVSPESPPVEGAAEVPAEIAADAPADTRAEAVAEASSDAVADAAAEVIDQPVSCDPAPSAALLPEAPNFVAGEETPAVVEAQSEPAAAVEAVAEPVAETTEAAPASEAVPAEAAGAEVASSEAASSEAAPAEPQLVEVWRPGGRSDERRPRHDRNRRHHRPHHRPQQDGAQAGENKSGEGGSGESKPSEGEKRERPRHHGRRDFRKPDAPQPEAAVAAEGAAREQRHDNKGDRRERFEGKGKNQGKDRDRDSKREKFGDRDGNRRDDRDRPRDKGRDRRDRESGPALRHYASSSNPRDRGAVADPNSPFAKLAALKEQLAGGNKD